MDKFDYKKEYKDLYLPKPRPALIDVPAMTFIMVDGQGAPATTSYQQAIQTLYTITFTIKMSKMNGQQPPGYFDYVVPPLESLWWTAEGRLDMSKPKTEWFWRAMIRQPEFVTADVFNWAVDTCSARKTDLDFSRAQLLDFTEGLCVQMMHIGSYDEESKTIQQLEEFISTNGLQDESGLERKHHEIYLSDPRRTAPQRLKTVLRLPVGKRG